MKQEEIKKQNFQAGVLMVVAKQIIGNYCERNGFQKIEKNSPGGLWEKTILVRKKESEKIRIFLDYLFCVCDKEDGEDWYNGGVSIHVLYPGKSRAGFMVSKTEELDGIEGFLERTIERLSS